MYFGDGDGMAPLANELVAWRENAGLSQRELAGKIPWSASYVAMVERCERLPSAEFTKACDELFGTPGTLSRMREQATRGLSGHPDWFVPYVRAEGEATVIWSYQCSFVHGVLQLPEYARELFRVAFPGMEEEQIESKVQSRMDRKQILCQEKPPLIWVVLDEAALRRVVGGPGLMRKQLDHLVTLSASPQIKLQVLSMADGSRGAGGTFTVLAQPDGQRLAYLDCPYLGQLTDDPSVVGKLSNAYQLHRADALPVRASIDLIRSISEEYASAQNA